MALLTSEVLRIRAELGYNVMGLLALPYIGIHAIFDQVIQQYITAGASTTSTTALAASTELATLTLASGTGVNAGDRIVVDVDDAQEFATVRAKPSANVVTVFLLKAHSGTYPVTVEGGESLVREALAKLRAVTGPTRDGTGGLLGVAVEAGGIKKVDEIEFFGGFGSLSEGKDQLSQVREMVEYYRDELASVLGVQRLNRRGGGQVCEMY